MVIRRICIFIFMIGSGSHLSRSPIGLEILTRASYEQANYQPRAEQENTTAPYHSIQRASFPTLPHDNRAYTSAVSACLWLCRVHQARDAMLPIVGCFSLTESVRNPLLMTPISMISWVSCLQAEHTIHVNSPLSEAALPLTAETWWWKASASTWWALEPRRWLKALC